MKRLFRGLVGLGLLVSSCYTAPRDLKLPDRYKNPSPYVSVTDENKGIRYFTLQHTKDYIGDIKDKIPELVKLVEKYEGFDTDKPIKVVVLHRKDYKRLSKNSYIREKSSGMYDMGDRVIVLKNFDEGFTEREQRTFIHELLHFLDQVSNEKLELSEEEIEEKIKLIIQ